METGQKCPLKAALKIETLQRYRTDQNYSNQLLYDWKVWPQWKQNISFWGVEWPQKNSEFSSTVKKYVFIILAKMLWFKW